MMLSNCSASLLSADHSPRRKHLNCDVAPTGQPEDAGLWSGGSKLSSYDGDRGEVNWRRVALTVHAIGGRIDVRLE